MSKVFKIDEGSTRVDIIQEKFTTSKELQKGFYCVEVLHGFMMSTKEIHISEEPVLPQSSLNVANRIFDADLINKFFSDKNKTIHQELNLKQKMGILLYGKQGTGKTTTCLAFSRKMVETMNARVFTVCNFEEFMFVVSFLKEAKKINDFFSIIIFDECEHSMYKHEATMKQILDSGESIDNNLFLFTTNYIDDIPEAIKNRPSRIKFCNEIKAFTDEVDVFSVVSEINSSFSDKTSLNSEQLNLVTGEILRNASEDGVTLDEIKNAVINFLIY